VKKKLRKKSSRVRPYSVGAVTSIELPLSFHDLQQARWEEGELQFGCSALTATGMKGLGVFVLIFTLVKFLLVLAGLYSIGPFEYICDFAFVFTNLLGGFVSNRMTLKSWRQFACAYHLFAYIVITAAFYSRTFNERCTLAEEDGLDGVCYRLFKEHIMPPEFIGMLTLDLAMMPTLMHFGLKFSAMSSLAALSSFLFIYIVVIGPSGQRQRMTFLLTIMQLVTVVTLATLHVHTTEATFRQIHNHNRSLRQQATKMTSLVHVLGNCKL